MIKTPLRGRKDPLKFASLPTCGFVAQLVERPTSIWEARVQAPSKTEFFSGFFFCNFFNCSLPARINSLLIIIIINLRATLASCRRNRHTGDNCTTSSIVLHNTRSLSDRLIPGYLIYSVDSQWLHFFVFVFLFSLFQVVINFVGYKRITKVGH